MRTTTVTISGYLRPERTTTIETVAAPDLVAAFESAVRLAGIDAEAPEVHDAIHGMLGLAGIVSASTWGGYLSVEGARHILALGLKQCGIVDVPVPEAGGAVTVH